MNVRRYALAAMAALALGPAAHAGDAVVPGEFDQPRAVDACDAYGTGFARLPGTSTCLRVGGRVRYDKSFSNRGGYNSGGRTELEFETRSD